MGLKKYAASDLLVVAYIVICDDIDGTHSEYEVENQELWDAGGKYHPSANKCDCCGHWLKYSCILYSISEQKYFSVGRTCTGKIIGLQRLLDKGMKNATISILERIACNKREKEFLDKNPQYAQIIADAKESNIPFVKELYGKLRRWGNLSEKQVFCIERTIREDKERRAAATNTVPVGKKEVIGKIISFKDKIDKYTGDVIGIGMLVDLGGGVRVYGTKPSSLEKQTGIDIRFRATFKVSDRDPLFGFFSNPRLVEPKGKQNEMQV